MRVTAWPRTAISGVDVTAVNVAVGWTWTSTERDVSDPVPGAWGDSATTCSV